jgi:hypothetical protein
MSIHRVTLLPRIWHGAVLIVVTVAIPIAGCAHRPSRACASERPAPHLQDLVMGYSLLQHTLDDEAKLDQLALLKKLMLSSPNDRITSLMRQIADDAEVSTDELAELRLRSPDVTGNPATKSAVGEDVQAIAKHMAEDEVISRASGFDIRFVMMQAQATRMVSATAQALAKHDQNLARQKWLGKLSKKYEGFRAELITYAGTHSR